MSNKLHDLIVRQIEIGGPMTVAAYMDLCLAHPEWGYYRCKDPIGGKGDFTTAPEISQLFGEMIGIWVADLWIRLKNPSKLILCECGPGRGTLMKDILRVARQVSGLYDVLSVHLVETSDVLIEKQKALLDAKIEFHASLETLPSDAPIIILGNEFLDALPFRQLVRMKSAWQERVIGLQDGKLVFGLGGQVDGSDLPSAEEGEIFEFSPVRDAVWLEMMGRVKQQGGAALMIDYGYVARPKVSTFQAVRDHSYADVLENPGEHDLTSLVDFSRLKELAQDVGVDGPITQGAFLKNMGIEIRAQKLAELNPDKRDDIYSGLKRLTHRDDMGELFKVIAVKNVS